MTCPFIHFGLIVTGQGEEEHLPKLFRIIETTGTCNFKVIRRIGQLSPLQSGSKKQLKMVGTGKIIPTEDESNIGLPARAFIQENSCRFVLVVDDLEHDRASSIEKIYERYRLALDTMLREQKHRASVHL